MYGQLQKCKYSRPRPPPPPIPKYCRSQDWQKNSGIGSQPSQKKHIWDLKISDGTGMVNEEAVWGADSRGENKSK